MRADHDGGDPQPPGPAGRPGRRLRVAALALLATALAPRPADAFLLVSKAKGAAADRFTVVALREGTQTVLTIEPHVRGPAGEVALIVPVPASFAEGSSLGLHAAAPLARVTAPRVVEYWELDPCELHDSLPSDGTLDTTAAAELSPPPPSSSAGGGTASPTYAVEMSTAKTGAELVASLKHDGYAFPDRIEAALDAYLKAGMKLAVARLDTTKLPPSADAGALPALQIHGTSNAFTLPTRLLAAGPGRRELSLYVLAPGVRFEASEQPNVAVPTNLDVTDGVRATPSAFYEALLDRTFEKSPGALVTEYAWRASGCELCAGPLAPHDLAALGGDLLPSAASGKQLEVLVDAATVAARPDGPPEVRAALTSCYATALAGQKRLAGDVSLAVEVGGDGSLTSVTPAGSADASLVKCATDAARAGKGWKAGTKGPVTVKFSPVSRAYFSDLVLTALRARYDAGADRDLSLTPARAIEGGREMGAEGTAEKNVHAAPAGNNFQARYAVRHPFVGAIKCDTPTRGNWGGPPKDTARTPPVAVKADGGVRLEAWIQGDLPDFSAFAVHFGPAVATGDPQRVPQPPPGPVPSAAPSPASAPPPASGCGACAVSATGGELPWGSLLAFAALALRRRRQRPPSR